MVGASKILTVSYGTFSCTLEGFEEPFGTMKAIAEYFRDLAADDRYFGAEPPIPDAAMLHRIAEREIHRRVEAKIQDNSVILRAGDLSAPQHRPAPTEAPAQDPRPAPRSPTGLVAEESVAARLSRIRNAAATQAAPTLRLVEDAVFTEDQHADAPAARAAPAPAAPIPAFAPEPQTAALAIDAAQVSGIAPHGAASPAGAPTPAHPAAVEVSQPGFAQPESVEPALAAPVQPELARPELVEPEPVPAAPVEPELARPEPVEPEPALAALVQPELARPEPVEPEPVLAEVAPIAALMADAEPEAPLTAAAFAEVAAEAIPLAAIEATEAEDLPETRDDDETEPLLLEPATPGDAMPQEGALILSAPVSADAEADAAAVPDIRAFMDSLLGDAPVADAGPVADPVAALADVLPEDAAADLPGDPADLLPEMIGDEIDAEAEAALQAALAAPSEPEDDADASDTDIGALIATLAGNDPSDVIAAEPAIAADADIWEDADDAAEPDLAAQDDGVIATLWPADPGDPAATDTPVAAPSALADRLRRARARVIKVRRPDLPSLPESPAALSPEAEAELQRELAEVEREADAHHRADREGLTVLEASANNDEAVNRLLRQTNSEMDGLDTRRRVSTIAHLKAAVAATVADLKTPAPAGGSQPSRLDSYRADLARVVRPRRPGDLSAADRPAPLVLVSEQRVDRPRPLQVAPQPQPEPTGARVLPRRVTSGNLAVEARDDDADPSEDAPDAPRMAPQMSGSFADFAEKLGATDLADLLEAAAAYTVCVEGRPYFSRPQVIRHVAEMSDDDLSREDGLRCFGQLLRQGRIAKVKRGHFEITETSRYLVEARRLAE